MIVPLHIEKYSCSCQKDDIRAYELFWTFCEQLNLQYNYALFCRNCGEIWCRKWADWPQGAKVRWIADYAEGGSVIILPYELDVYLEDRDKLSPSQKEFLLHEYVTHRNYYTSNAFASDSGDDRIREER